MAGNKRSGANPVGKLLAWLRRRRRPRSVDDDSYLQPAGAGPMQGMSWHDFELLVGDMFRLQGYSVGGLDRATAGEGADLVVRRGNKTLLVAYKQWNAATVGIDAVRDLDDAMAVQGADGGILLTLGRFSTPAQAAARGADIDLMDGARLVPIIQQAQATRMAETGPAPLQARPRGR